MKTREEILTPINKSIDRLELQIEKALQEDMQLSLRLRNFLLNIRKLRTNLK
jgi:hypothetical protein